MWKPLTNPTDPKTAGRACYNMALAAEMEGKLDIAVTWTRKAYETYNIRPARTYLNQLEQRQRHQEKLRIQMDGVE